MVLLMFLPKSGRRIAPLSPDSDCPKQWLARLEMEVEEDGDSQKTENEKGGAF